MYLENHPQFMQVTLSYVDSYFLRKDGQNSATNDINMNTHKLMNVAEPTNSQDAATKNYVENNLQKSYYLEIDAN